MLYATVLNYSTAVLYEHLHPILEKSLPKYIAKPRKLLTKFLMAAIFGTGWELVPKSDT